MSISINRNQLSAPFIGVAVAAAAAMAIQSPAFAQQEAPSSSLQSGSSQTEGRIIYSRDVPYGSAIGPRTPSHEHTVVTGPTNLVLSSLAAGLEPMSDDENAGISADINSQVGPIGDHTTLGMGRFSGTDGPGTAASTTGDIQSSVVGAAIGQAAGTISNVMGSLRGMLGGGK